MASKTLTFNIIGRSSGATKAIQNVGSAASRITKTFAILGGAIAGAMAVRRIVDFSRVAVREFAEAEDSQNRLTDAFDRFPKTADLNIKALRELNTQLQNKTKFDDDALAAAQASLAQYNLTGTQIAKLTPLLADFAAKTGKDLPTAAGLLGKALLGQGKGLKAIGVNFKDAGSVTANYAQLLDILSDKVGGFAEKQGLTFSGQLAILSNQFGELKEKVGSLFAPALGDLADLMAQKVLPRFDEFVTVVGPRVQAFLKGGAAQVGKFIDALSGLGKGDFSGVQKFFEEAGKSSPFFAALSVLAATIQPILPVLADGLLKIGSALTEEGVLDSLTVLITDVLPPLVELLVAITPLIPPLASLLSTLLVPSLTNTSTAFGMFGKILDVVSGKRPLLSLLGDIQSAKGPIGDGMRAIVGSVVGAGNFIIGIANTIVGAIENIINAIARLTGIGATVHLPRITGVKGYSVSGGGGKSGKGGKGGHNQSTGRSMAGPAGGMSAVSLAAASAGTPVSQAGATTYSITVGTLIADDDRAVQQLLRKVQGATSRGAVPRGAFA